MAEIQKEFNKKFKKNHSLNILYAECKRRFGNARKLHLEIFIKSSAIKTRLNLETQKENAPKKTPNNFKWVKNYKHYALYEKELPTKDIIRECFCYSDIPSL